MKKIGYFIALFGPDGAGKTTTADTLDSLIRQEGQETHRFHWRPRVLPSLNKNIQEIDETRPDTHTVRSSLLSTILYFYFFLDFVCGYFFKIMPLKRAGVIIIYERYYYDILFHPRRYKLVALSGIGLFLSKLIPQPDLIVLLSGEPTVILERKPELPLDEIERQTRQMKEKLSGFGRSLYVDVTMSTPEQNAIEILSQLVCNHNVIGSGGETQA